MQRIIGFLAFGVFFGVAAAGGEARLAPDWTMSTAAGEDITLSEEVKEQPVILLFWATWCPYCKAFMPHLQSIQLEYGDRVRVLALHFRDDKGDPVAFIENAGYDFTLIPDSNDIAKLYDVWGTPGVVVVDQNRNVRFDLYSLPTYELPARDESPSHSTKAAYKAPYWAAELRKSLDRVLDSS